MSENRLYIQVSWYWYGRYTVGHVYSIIDILMAGYNIAQLSFLDTQFKITYFSID